MAEKPAAPADKAGDASKKKMNPQVAAMIKHQFWIIGGIALTAAVVVWFLGTSALDAQFADDKRKIDAQFTQMSMLDNKRGVNALPSEHFIKEVKKLQSKLSDQVIAAWTNLYERQTATLSKRKVDLLAVHPRVPDLRDLILKTPAERKLLINSEISQQLQSYLNNRFLDEDFTQLFAGLNLRHPRSIDVFGRPVPGVDATDKTSEGILVWASTSGKPGDILNRYRTRVAPGIDRVAVTYEDIWVFRSMFSAIQTINSKPIDTWLEVMKGKPESVAPVDQANVPIKRIEYCDLAQWAMFTSFDDPGDVPIGGAGLPGMPDQMGGGGGGNNNNGAFAVGNEGTVEEEQVLLKGRYLDGRNALVSDPSQPPFTEFRQIYVQLRVLMDQRLIPVLIAECANAPLPIETRQVRLSMAAVDDIKKGAAVGADVNAVQQSPHDAIVTVRGVVFIYTKPDSPKEIAEGNGRLGKGADPEPGKRDFGLPKKDMVTGGAPPVF